MVALVGRTCPGWSRVREFLWMSLVFLRYTKVFIYVWLVSRSLFLWAFLVCNNLTVFGLASTDVRSEDRMSDWLAQGIPGCLIKGPRLA